MRSGREVYTQKNSTLSAAKEGENLSIIHLLYNNDNNTFAVVTIDHNIIIYSLQTFECLKQVNFICIYISLIFIYTFTITEILNLL